MKQTSITFSRNSAALVFPEDVEINPQDINDGTEEKPWYRIVIGNPESYESNPLSYNLAYDRLKDKMVLDEVHIEGQNGHLRLKNVLVERLIKRSYGVFFELETDHIIYKEG